MTPSPRPAWQQVVRGRVLIGAAVLALWAAGIVTRLVVLQVQRHDEFVGRAARQRTQTVDIAPQRGDMVDRRGRLLAYSVEADTIYAVPTEIADAPQAARQLCDALGDCTPKERDALESRLSKRRAFAYVRRQASPAQARAVAALNLDGVGFLKEHRRLYPNRELAAHLLGYVGTDNKGLGGLEAAYDGVVRGTPGTMLVQTDARRRPFQRAERAAARGATLELTIDQTLQHIVERELGAAVRQHKADGGTAVVMDPSTGEVLAMASAPTFNPNVFGDASADARRNRAVQDIYEPGSTFKIVTASAALEEHVFSPNELIDTGDGQIRFDSRVIRDDHPGGVMSFTQALVTSSNVGAIRMGLRLGPQRLGVYVRRFGFGQSTSPDFPAETSGIVWNPARLTDSALASVSMGYQVGVTPLQMVTAASAVANGGQLLEPRVLRAVVRDGVRTPVEPRVVRRAVSTATAAELTEIMEGVVERGTATAARLDGFTVAGKTGTASKLVNGAYSKSAYNASFVGFVPSRDPAFTILVVIDTPRVGSYYGGIVAAPVFKRIASQALRLRGVLPSVGRVPPVLVARRDANAPRMAPAIDRMRTPTVVPIGDTALVPDLRGLSARDALQTLARVGLKAQLTGDGIVVDQQPAAGAPFEVGDTCTLMLGRDPSRPPVAASGGLR